jgi:integrase
MKEKFHRSKDRDRYSYKRLFPYFGHVNMADIKRPLVRAYIDTRVKQGVSLSTIGRELRFASAAVNYVRLEHEVAISNPFVSLRLSTSDYRIRWITPDEGKRLVIEAARYARTPCLPCFIRLALNTGCRRGELLGLEWSRVDLTRRVFLLEAKHTKTARLRTVPLNIETYSALSELWEWHCQKYSDSPWVFPFGGGFRHIYYLKTGFKNACKRAGIDDFRIHDLQYVCKLACDGGCGFIRRS